MFTKLNLPTNDQSIKRIIKTRTSPLRIEIQCETLKTLKMFKYLKFTLDLIDFQIDNSSTVGFMHLRDDHSPSRGRKSTVSMCKPTFRHSMINAVENTLK